MGEKNKDNGKDKDNGNKEIKLTEEQFQEAVKEAGLESSLDQYVQKISDKRVSEGIKTYQGNQEKKDLSDKERIESLETELKEMKNGKTKEDVKTLVKAELKKQDLSEDLLKYVKIDNDDLSKIAEAVTGLKDDLLNAKQAEIDQKLKDETAPPHGETDTGKGDQVTENYAKNKNAGVVVGNPFGGKLDEGKSEK